MRPKLYLAMAAISLSLVSHFNASGQTNFGEGYLVTTFGDTLRGLVSKDSGVRPFDACQFKQGKKDKPTRHTPLEVKAYRTENTVRVSRIVKIKDDVDTVFLELLASGRVNLFKYFKYSNTYFFVQKEDGIIDEITDEKITTRIQGNLITIPSNRYKSQLRLVFADCPAMSNSLVKAVFQEQRLVKLIEEYNACAISSPEK